MIEKVEFVSHEMHTWHRSEREGSGFSQSLTSSQDATENTAYDRTRLRPREKLKRVLHCPEPDCNIVSDRPCNSRRRHDQKVFRICDASSEWSHFTRVETHLSITITFSDLKVISHNFTSSAASLELLHGVSIRMFCISFFSIL